MGIIKKIVIALLMVFVVSLSAQTQNDSLLIKGKMYIQHTVKPTETYKIISKKYNVSINDLKSSNKNVKLYFNQQLLVPVKSTFSERILFKSRQLESTSIIGVKKQSDTLNIALLFPFYTTKNDSLLSFLAKSQQLKEDVYKKSYMALSFLEGVIIAIDSLSKTGMKINLFVYDTENDTSKVQQIIAEEKLKNIDLIIGPAYQKNLLIVAKEYGKNSDKTIVSPLSKNSNVLKYGSNIYQIIPPEKVQIKNISDYISEKYKDERILILAQKKNEKHAKEYKKVFRKNKRRVKIRLFDGFTDITKDTICTFLSNNKYIVLIPSTDRSFVSKIIPVLGTIDTNMTVFGLYNWGSFENLDIETLMKLNVHFPNPYFFDYENKLNKRFVMLFKDKFSELPDKYAQLAFAECLYFCTNKGDYKFKKYYQRGGKLNYNLPLVKYSDYSIKKVD